MSFINRELSWLEFNQRVLEQAKRHDLPILERLKFLAITASNMDEFFQVRVGGLQLISSSENSFARHSPDTSGLNPAQQLAAIRSRAQTMSDDQYQLYNDELLPALTKERLSITKLTKDLLSPAQSQQLLTKFQESIYPLLTPLAHCPENHSPELPAMQIILACELQNNQDDSQRVAFIPVPESIPRFTPITAPRAGIDNHLSQKNSSSQQQLMIPVEDIISTYGETLFPDEKLISSMPFRLTRNSDIALEEENTLDLAGEMKEVLAARKHGQTVRLEYNHQAPSALTQKLKAILNTGSEQVCEVYGPLALSDLMSLAFSSGYDHLRRQPWEPQPSPSLDPSISIFDTLAAKDILLHHPYESFDPVIRLLEEAAEDPATVAIKQVLYRTAPSSRIINALIKAAQRGKQVTVIIELKARFDEARNLMRADELHRAGAQIVYGVKGLKTHAKICLVIRNEEGLLKRYVHLGTGNYNEATSRIYTDISYLTARPAYGADASLFFNALTGRSKLTRFQKLIAAPTQMKPRILELIAAEAQRASDGQKASITAKVNSLQDPEIITALQEAARCGVKIRLNIRGICCLQTGTSDGLENIRIISVIDRYLEHARAFSFHHGGRPLLYIASADWMTRNLDKRVELMIPIEDQASKKRLHHILEAAFIDNSNSYEITPDGTSRKTQPEKGSKRINMQESLQQLAENAARRHAHQSSTTFEPHTPID